MNNLVDLIGGQIGLYLHKHMLGGIFLVKLPNWVVHVRKNN